VGHHVWLETRHDEAATMRLHAYCMDCGAVRSRLPARGRPQGYFERAVANLKRVLEDHPRLPKLAQVQSHLILSSLAAIPAFDDPYSMDFETQRALFIQAVQRTRRDVDLELVEEVLPRDIKRARPAFIDLIGAAGGGPASVIGRSSLGITVSLGP
jgi:hypothetical protein